MKNLFLVTTAHLTDRLWFRDEEDFRVAMNYVAIAAFCSGIIILSFILMSNHVHFVLSCSRERADLFINKFKRLYSAYYRRKYGVGELLRRNDWDVVELDVRDESLEKAIAYVMMNSVAANICLEASGYPWGTGDLLFNSRPLSTRRLSEMSARAQIRLLKSNIRLPQEYKVTSDGYIWPGSYIPFKRVESIFRTPKRLNYFLKTSSKARLRMEKDPMPSFRDQSILAACEDLCHSLFRVSSIDELSAERKAELLRQLGRRFSSDLNQLCRVTGIPFSEAARLLDTF